MPYSFLVFWARPLPSITSRVPPLIPLVIGFLSNTIGPGRASGCISALAGGGAQGAEASFRRSLPLRHAPHRRREQRMPPAALVRDARTHSRLACSVNSYVPDLVRNSSGPSESCIPQVLPDGRKRFRLFPISGASHIPRIRGFVLSGG